jgi:ferredoxin
MLTIRIDPDLCESNAVCVRHAPEVFEIGEDGQLRLLIEHPAEELREKVEEAVERCPRVALSLIKE